LAASLLELPGKDIRFDVFAALALSSATQPPGEDCTKDKEGDDGHDNAYYNRSLVLA
jgi:hypothetical protein